MLVSILPFIIDSERQRSPRPHHPATIEGGTVAGKADSWQRHGTTSLSGSAICLKCDVDATIGTLANGSFQFKGSGKLE